MTPDAAKAKSRAVSRDMSPQALSRRLDILVELDQTARLLEGARRIEARAGASRARRPRTT